jgi:hypothetical protein
LKCFAADEPVTVERYVKALLRHALGAGATGEDVKAAIVVRELGSPELESPLLHEDYMKLVEEEWADDDDAIATVAPADVQPKASGRHRAAEGGDSSFDGVSFWKLLLGCTAREAAVRAFCASRPHTERSQSLLVARNHDHEDRHSRQRLADQDARRRAL